MVIFRHSRSHKIKFTQPKKIQYYLLILTVSHRFQLTTNNDALTTRLHSPHFSNQSYLDLSGEESTKNLTIYRERLNKLRGINL